MNLDKVNKLIREALQKPLKENKGCKCGCNDCNKAVVLKESKITSLISEDLKYHIDNKIPLHETEFRIGSDSHLSLIREARKLYSRDLIDVNESDKFVLESNLGHFGEYKNEMVPLDLPMLNEAEYKGRDVDLNKPMRSSGPKKYKVYVKNDKGNVIQVNFGDVKGGLKSKINDPEARKAFADRHNCDQKKDKTKAGYWSCNLPRYAKLLGLGGNMNTFW